MILRQFAGRPQAAGLIIFAAGIVILLARLVYDLIFEMAQARKEYRILSQSGLISGPDIPQKGRPLAGAIEKNRQSRKLDFSKLRENEAKRRAEAGEACTSKKQAAETVISPGRFATVPLEDPEDPEDQHLAAPCDAYRTVSLEK